MTFLIFHFRSRLKKYLNKVGFHRADRALMVPKMTYNEYRFFKDYLAQNTSALYLESGSGGSTLIAERLGINFHAYETSDGYAHYMNSLLKAPRVSHIPIGRTAKYGRPLEKTKKNAEQISGVFDMHITNNTDSHNVVFLDGRCRVLTALRIHSLLGDNDSVLIHDFHRPNYQDVLQAYEIIDRVDSLVLLRKSNHISKDQIQALTDEYQLDFE